MSETKRQAHTAYEAWSAEHNPIEAGPYEAFVAGYWAALNAGCEDTIPTDTAQGALFDMPAPKPRSAIAEGR